jgi:uncharacterized protein
MKSPIFHAVMALMLSLSIPPIASADNEKILVFKDASPYDGHIPAIKAGIAMFREFGAANKFSIDTTITLSTFNGTDLAKYSAIIFLHPFGANDIQDTMNESQDSAFQSFMTSGKGLMGIHCADRVNNNWPWYLNLLGVQYQNDIGPQSCTYHVADVNNSMTRGILPTFVNSQQVRCNKLFFSDTSREFTVLVKADEKDYPSGQKQTFYPYVWTHDYKGARVWCGSMGHTPETFSSDTIWRKLMLRGILYALNRPGYGKPTACKDSDKGLAPTEAEKWATNGGEDGIVLVFDCAGRGVGRMDRRQLMQNLKRPTRGMLSTGIYLVDVPSNKNHRTSLRVLFAHGTN